MRCSPVNMQLRACIAAGAAVMGSCAGVESRGNCDGAVKAEYLSSQHLVLMMCRLPAWSRIEEWSSEDVKSYAIVAQLCQRAEKNEVIEAMECLEVYQAELARVNSRPTVTVVMILMRFIFDTPVSCSRDDFRFETGMMNVEEAVVNGFVNPTWPLSFGPDGVRILAPFQGYGRDVADFTDIYQYYSERYSYRDIHKYIK